MTMTIDLTKITVGVQPDIKLSILKQVPILEVLGQIPTSIDLRKKTEEMRKVNDKDEYTALKGKLPVVIISSESKIRSQQEDDKHTGFMWADIDKCGTDENKKVLSEAITIVEDLMKDYPYIIGYFISPSGNGLKVLCAIEPDINLHTMSFKAVSDLFYAHDLNVDKQTSDRKRPCFVCYDANATDTLINPLKAWTGKRIKPAQPREVKAYKVPKREYADELTDLDKVEKCLPFIHPDEEYLKWVQVGMVIKDSGGSCAMWDEWSAGGQLYRSGLCEQKWKSFGSGGVGIGSVINWAKQSNGGENPLFPKKFKRVDVGVDFSEVQEIEAVEEVEGVEPAGEDKLWQWLQTRAFDEMNPPVVAPAILNLGDAPVIWLQNIHTLVAGSKSGKTHAMASMIRSWVTGERSLGWNCDKIDGRVVYLDFEQDSEDFYNVLFKHAGVTSHDVSAYRCAGLSVGSALKAVEMILERTPNVKVLIMDGYADLIMDTNDSGESNDSVARWMKLATDHNIAIVGALHLNPNSESKSRGHLGSQLERKSKTVLKIDVDGNGVRETYTQLARKQMVFKGHGVFWKWEGNGFIEVMGHAEQKVHDKMVEDRSEFDKFCRLSLTKEWAFSDLLADIQEHLNLKESASKNRITLWRDYKFIEKPDGSLKYTAK